MSETSERIMKQVAHMDIVGVSTGQIAEAMGVDDARVSQIIALPAYQQIKEVVAAEKQTFNSDMNDGWDKLEKTSVANLQEVMRYNKDPDMNLRIAAVANKANRRGSSQTINQVPGARVAISLPITFVNMIKSQNGVLMTQKVEVGPQELTQRFDILKPHQVEETLKGVGTGMFAGIDFNQKEES